jgi:hypothetical protein
MISPLHLDTAESRVLGSGVAGGSGVLSRTRSRNSFQRRPKFPPLWPLCDAFLSSGSSARKPRTEVRCCRGPGCSFPPAFTKQFSTPALNSPLCDLCDLCAMLSPLRVVHAWKLRCPPTNLPPALFFLTEAWEKVPQSFVYSQSTILGGHKASLVSHRGLNIFKRIGGTGQETGIIKR